MTPQQFQSIHDLTLHFGSFYVRSDAYAKAVSVPLRTNSHPKIKPGSFLVSSYSMLTVHVSVLQPQLHVFRVIKTI